METGHPSTRAVNSGSGNRALTSANFCCFNRLIECMCVHSEVGASQTLDDDDDDDEITSRAIPDDVNKALSFRICINVC